MIISIKKMLNVPTSSINTKHKATTLSILCTLVGCLIVFLSSLGYLISLIVLIVEGKTLLELNDKQYGTMLLVFEFVAVSFFLMMSIVGMVSVVDCTASLNSTRYFSICAYVWTFSILLSLMAMTCLIGGYGSKLDSVLNTTQPKDDQAALKTYKFSVLYYSSFVGVACTLLICCCVPLFMCGILRIVVTRKNSQVHKYRPLYDGDQIMD